MLSILLLKYETLIWRRIFKKHALDMFFPKLANMPQVMKKFGGVLNMFASSLPEQTYKNASIGQKHLVKAGKNGTRLAFKLV